MKDIKEVLQTEDGIEEAAKDSANGEYKRNARAAEMETEA